MDTDVPPMPVFGLNLVGQGTVDLIGLGFTNLTNTHTILAGTLTLFYWDELSSPSAFTLAGAIAATDTTITLSSAGAAVAGSLIQIEGEILTVVATVSGGTQYQVTRGSLGSTASAHAATIPIPIYHLKTNVGIVPFVTDFFGSPASGSYSSSIFLPDARVAAAEFFVTNVRGNSPVASASFGATVDQGLRTLSGGQFSIQVEGYLAIQTDAAPPLVIESAHAARDISAVLSEAPSQPSGSPPGTNTLKLQLRLGSTVYCTLKFDDGALTSNATVSGFGLAPLAAGSQLVLDILAVHGEPNSLPGRDLTVTVRL